MLEYNCCGGGGKYDGNNGRAGIDWLYPYHDHYVQVKRVKNLCCVAVATNAK